METTKTKDKVLTILLKEPFVTHTATSVAKALGITRQGIWKTLNKLVADKLISSKHIGEFKTSAVILKLNWENILTEKTLSLLLTKEALKQRRWMENFFELKDKVKFVILFGSILINSKEANDIDILAVVDKKNFKAIDKTILKIQSTQIKKIHFIDLTEAEFIHEIKKPNKPYIDAIKKGVVLYGQDEFVQFVKELK